MFLQHHITHRLDDIGGGYSDSLSEMCSELSTQVPHHITSHHTTSQHPQAVPILIITPNGRTHAGVNQDALIFNPDCTSPQHLQACYALWQ